MRTEVLADTLAKFIGLVAPSLGPGYRGEAEQLLKRLTDSRPTPLLTDQQVLWVEECIDGLDHHHMSTHALRLKGILTYLRGDD